jgi:hypothetical protein
MLNTLYSYLGCDFQYNFVHFACVLVKYPLNVVHLFLNTVFVNILYRKIVKLYNFEAFYYNFLFYTSFSCKIS